MDSVVVIEEAKNRTKKGSKIPQDEIIEEKRELKLDPHKLSEIMFNTSNVHQTLSEIFAEESELKSKFEPIERPEEYLPLEDIINLLIKKKSWTQRELMEIVPGKAPMLSGFLDQINEWAEATYGDFLIEEDDNLYILNDDVLKFIKNRE